MMLPVLLTVWLIQAVGSSNPDDRNFGHERVLENILKNYRDAQFLVRPAETTSAEIGIVLCYIKSMNRNNGRLVAGYWLKQSWIDSRLKWEDLSVSSIHLPPDKIWKPDWRVFNSLDHVEKVDKSVMPLVRHNGYVIWVPPAEYTTTCSRVEKDDDQRWNCELRIGSWTHNGNQMSHHFYENSSLVDVTPYRPELNGYEVEPVAGDIENKYYSCCTEPYETVIFRFRLQLIEGGVASGVGRWSQCLSTLLAVLLVCAAI